MYITISLQIHKQIRYKYNINTNAPPNDRHQNRWYMCPFREFCGPNLPGNEASTKLGSQDGEVASHSSVANVWWTGSSLGSRIDTGRSKEGGHGQLRWSNNQPREAPNSSGKGPPLDGLEPISAGVPRGFWWWEWALNGEHLL